MGAGPAGSTAAEVAARSAKVVLIDRKSEIGSPVQCGGFLPEPFELERLMPRARLPETLIEIPESCILHRTRLQRIYSPSGKGKEFPVAGRVLDRRAFDRYLAGRAARAGVRVLPATRADLNDGTLRLSGRFSGSLRPQIIIGADGPHSIVSNSMGNPVQELGLCLEYEMVGVKIDVDAAEMYFSANYAPGGYAWIIPMGPDTANVGVGVRASYLSGRKLPDILDRFVNEHPVAAKKLACGEVLAVMRGLVPAGGSQGTIQKSNMLLAGDAAGHVMATSGGGHTIGHGGRKDRGRSCNQAFAGQNASAGVPVAHSRRVWNRVVAIGPDKENCGYAMKSDSLMNALFASIKPRTDEISNARRDPSAAQSSRTV